jgi:hypothetical protein
LARIPGAPQPIGYRAISDADIPADRTYRNAWTDDGSVIRHDMPKARDLHIQRVRRARGLRLEDLDAKWMRASGQKKQNEADEIESQRQTLRDLPMTLKVEEAQTIEDLKGKWSPLLDGV